MMRKLFLVAIFCLLNAEGAALALDPNAPSWVGIGVVVTEVHDNFVISEVFPNGPAANAGIQVNDRILEVGGTKVEGMNIDQVLGLLRGELGSMVKVTVDRPKASLPLSFSIRRKPLHAETKPPSSLD